MLNQVDHKARRGGFLASLVRAGVVVVLILLGAAAWLWFSEIAPRNARREAAHGYARQLEAQFESDGRYPHIRLTDTGNGGGGLFVSGAVRRGELAELKHIVEAGTPVKHVEYLVTELDAAKYEAAEAAGKLTMRREH